MRKVGVLSLTAVFLFLTVAPASAHGPGFHRAPLWPLLAPLWLPVAVAATVTTGVAAVASGVATAITAPFTYPYAPAGPSPTYAPGPAVYAPPPPSVYSSPPPVAYAPSAYARPTYAAAPPPAPAYLYYCPTAGSYYPNVAACPGGWLTVVPR